MQSTISQAPEKIKGTEVLAFDHVEITKTKTGTTTFVGIGTLSVTYFPELQRFLLFCGDWEYALLKRIPITASSRTEMKTRTYTFPTYQGFYTLKINKIPHPEALQNFETVLSNYAKFSYLGEELPVRQIPLSPDVSLVESVESAPGSTTGSGMLIEEPYMTSSHLRGKDKLKRGFAKIADKLTGSHAKHIKDNLYLTRVMEIEDLINPKQDFAETDDFFRREIEHYILKSKDIAAKMMFGASPNELQVIDTSLLREKIQEEEIVREDIMTESIQMTTYTENGIEYLIPQQEADILKQIEQERLLQEEERRLQEVHRQNELALIEEERQIRNRIRLVQESKRVHAISKTERVLQSEIDKREEMLLEGARLREAETTAFDIRERELIEEVQRRLTELRAKEALTEEEHAEFARRERQLMEANARIEAMRKEAELREAEVRKTVLTKMEEIQKRINMTEAERKSLKEYEEELEKEMNLRLTELRNKVELTEAERIELVDREQKLRELAALKEAERIQIIQEREELTANSAIILEELKERERLTVEEREKLRLREIAIEENAKNIQRDLLAKEALTEAERAELALRTKELTHIAALREAERVEYVRRQEEIAIEAQRRIAVLVERQRLTEQEVDELEKIRIGLQMEAATNEMERVALIEQRNRLLEEAEKRASEINRRISMTQAEREALQKQEEMLENQIERKLAELRLKEELTEGERVELQMRERELIKLHEMKKMETAVRTGQLDKLREQEEKLIKQNMELIQGHKIMHNEIIDMSNQLEKPLVEVREKRVETVQRTENYEDVTTA